MKLYRFLLALILIPGMILVGCQPENVKPKTDNSGIAADESNQEHDRPSPQCGQSAFYDVVNALGQSIAPASQGGADYGQIEIANDPDEIFIFSTLGTGWYARSISLYIGATANVPTNPVTGVISWETFPWSFALSPSQNFWQCKVARSSVPAGASTFLFNAEIHKNSFFSQPIYVTRVWGTGGDAILNAWGMNYNMGTCALNTSLVENCKTVLSGFNGTACAQLVVNEPLDGVAPYTYTWSNGMTGQGITVCPTVTTTYTVTITDANGATGTCEGIVNSIGIGCGNFVGAIPEDPNGYHKVKVCHLPPGNPGNQQNICIDRSGVGAHVAAFRDPNANPNHGHDSGCSVGPCGLVSPCN